MSRFTGYPMARATKSTVKPYLLVDLSNLVYRQAYSLSWMKSPDGRMSGGVFGSLRTMISWSEYFNIIVFADGGSPERKVLLDTYKAGRTDTMMTVTGDVIPAASSVSEPPDMEHEGDSPAEDIAPTEPVSLKETVFTAIDDLLKYLPSFGYPLVHNRGLEADDLIAAAALYLKDATGREVYILSTDKDFDQLPAHKVFPRKKPKPGDQQAPWLKDHVLHPAGALISFPEVPEDANMRKFPHLLLFYRALLGDASDKIPRAVAPPKRGNPWEKALWSRNPENKYLFDYFSGQIALTLQEALSSPTPGELIRTAPALQATLQKLIEDPSAMTTWVIALQARKFDFEFDLGAFIRNVFLMRIPYDLTKSLNTPIPLYHPTPSDNPFAPVTLESLQEYTVTLDELINHKHKFNGFYANPVMVTEICASLGMNSFMKRYPAGELTRITVLE